MYDHYDIGRLHFATMMHVNVALLHTNVYYQLPANV